VDLLSSPGTLYRHMAVEIQPKKHVRTSNIDFAFYCNRTQSKAVKSLIRSQKLKTILPSTLQNAHNIERVWYRTCTIPANKSLPSRHPSKAESDQISHSQIIWCSEVGSSVSQRRGHPLFELNVTMTGRVQDKATTVAHPSLQNQGLVTKVVSVPHNETSLVVGHSIVWVCE
jgi:hypothetical protein